jgi:hypothetical protein
MKSLFLFLLVPLLTCAAIAEPKAPARPATVEEIPQNPQTEKELKAWLQGTKWITDDTKRLECVFRETRFETPLSKPTYTVKERRMVVINWGKGVKVRCVISEDLTSMKEMEGMNVVYKFDGRIPAEERKTKLNPGGR